jgi:plastocyanin
MNLRTAIPTTLLLAALTFTGCKPHTPAPAADIPAVKPAYTGPTGSVTGTISFTGKPLAPVVIDTSMDPACSIGSTGNVTTEQFVVTAGKLANVFLYLKSGPAAAMQAAPAPSQPVILDQKNCRYTPHVIAVQQGGTVEFHNSDSTMHNIHTMPTAVGNETIDVSQGPKGAPQSKQFAKPELMIPVRCNNHPWMNAFINVSATPFFAVTDNSGHFELRGLPPGDYVLGAVHEKLGEKTIAVHVAPDTTANAELAFDPK